MEPVELLNLLLDENKVISNWETILTYMSKRMSSNDLDGLYSIAKAAAYRAELDKTMFSTAEVIKLNLFLCEILIKENVPWRSKQHLKYIEENLLPNLVDTLNEEDNDELSEMVGIYYSLAKTYKKINLAKKAYEHFLNAKETYLLLGNKLDASFCYSEAIYMIHRLPKEERIFPKEENLKAEFPNNYKLLIKALSGRGVLKYDPIENSEKYLNIINDIEEKIVRSLNDVKNPNSEIYIKTKKFLLKEEGIEWKPLVEMNKSMKL